MVRLLITYSLSYDWLVRGRPEEDWRPVYERGLAYQAAARAQWEPHEPVVFAAFGSFGLQFWETWPAYPVTLPESVPAFKDPLTFRITEDWDYVFTTLVHELSHLHEDHPANRSRYEPVLAGIRARFHNESEDVHYHLITCTLQRAVLMQAFPDRWQAMVDRAGRISGHPALVRTWQLIGDREQQIDWRDPLTSLSTVVAARTWP